MLFKIHISSTSYVSPEELFHRWKNINIWQLYIQRSSSKYFPSISSWCLSSVFFQFNRNLSLLSLVFSCGLQKFDSPSDCRVDPAYSFFGSSWYFFYVLPRNRFIFIKAGYAACFSLEKYKMVNSKWYESICLSEVLDRSFSTMRSYLKQMPDKSCPLFSPDLVAIDFFISTH